tara:strand:- start:211 stop:432 length:222 start_codon:yes stop_codon:yes gene_type:complete
LENNMSISKKQKDFLIAWVFIMLALTAFWGAIWYFGWLEEVIGLCITILAGIFAWESTMIVEEQKQARRKNGR